MFNLGKWKGLEVSLPWISEKWRKDGAGTFLKKVEKKARTLGVDKDFLDAFDFQIEEFYIKNGYIIQSQVEDFFSGHKGHYMHNDIY